MTGDGSLGWDAGRGPQIKKLRKVNGTLLTNGRDEEKTWWWRSKKEGGFDWRKGKGQKKQEGKKPGGEQIVCADREGTFPKGKRERKKKSYLRVKDQGHADHF